MSGQHFLDVTQGQLPETNFGGMRPDLQPRANQDRGAGVVVIPISYESGQFLPSATTQYTLQLLEYFSRA